MITNQALAEQHAQNVAQIIEEEVTGEWASRDWTREWLHLAQIHATLALVDEVKALRNGKVERGARALVAERYAKVLSEKLSEGA